MSQTQEPFVNSFVVWFRIPVFQMVVCTISVLSFTKKHVQVMFIRFSVSCDCTADAFFSFSFFRLFQAIFSLIFISFLKSLDSIHLFHDHHWFISGASGRIVSVLSVSFLALYIIAFFSKEKNRNLIYIALFFEWNFALFRTQNPSNGKQIDPPLFEILYRPWLAGWTNQSLYIGKINLSKIFIPRKANKGKGSYRCLKIFLLFFSLWYFERKRSTNKLRGMICFFSRVFVSKLNAVQLPSPYLTTLTNRLSLYGQYGTHFSIAVVFVLSVI